MAKIINNTSSIKIQIALTDVLTFSSSAIIAKQPVNLPDGAVGTPSLTFENDTNTGLYRSAADTIHLVTGGTSAITIDSSQQVGIGTTPSYKVDVTAGNNDGIRIEASDNNVAYILTDSATGGYRLNYNIPNDRLQIDRTSAAGVYSSGLVFINSSGQVGIGGVPTAGYLLEVAGKVKLSSMATEDITIDDAGSAGATEQDWIEVSVGGNTGYVRVYAAK